MGDPAHAGQVHFLGSGSSTVPVWGEDEHICINFSLLLTVDAMWLAVSSFLARKWTVIWNCEPNKPFLHGLSFLSRVLFYFVVFITVAEMDLEQWWVASSGHVWSSGELGSLTKLSWPESWRWSRLDRQISKLHLMQKAGCVGAAVRSWRRLQPDESCVGVGDTQVGSQSILFPLMWNLGLVMQTVGAGNGNH